MSKVDELRKDSLVVRKLLKKITPSIKVQFSTKNEEIKCEFITAGKKQHILIGRDGKGSFYTVFKTEGLYRDSVEKYRSLEDVIKIILESWIDYELRILTNSKEGLTDKDLLRLRQLI